MRIEENHAHATMIYQPVTFKHFTNLFKDVLSAKKGKYISLTTHLPFAIDNASKFSKSQQILAQIYIGYGQFLKSIFNIKLYWENCPVFNEGIWSIKYGQTEWKNVPKNIDLCIDTGHLMMGAKSKKEARERIRGVLKKRGSQIKHLHIHENNLVSDLHLNPLKRKPSERVIDSSLLKLMQKNRTYIFEKPS